MDNFFIVVLIPFTGGIVEALKRATGEKGKDFIPLISIITGLILSLIFAPAEFNLVEKGLSGLIVGLAATGGFENLKHLFWSKPKGKYETKVPVDTNSTRG